MDKKTLNRFISLKKSGVSSLICCTAILQTLFPDSAKSDKLYSAAELLDTFYFHVYKNADPEKIEPNL